MQSALKMVDETAENKKTAGTRLDRYLNQKTLEPFIYKDKEVDHFNPIDCYKGNSKINGFEEVTTMQNEIVNGVQICSDCGVEKHGIVFKTKHDHILHRSSSADFVKTRICKHCDRGNCINRDGKIDKRFDVKL